MNQFDANAQYRACQQLLAAVVALAVEDTQLAPIKRGRSKQPKQPVDAAITAIRFLFTDNSDGYFAALDINPKQFRERLLHKMYYNKADPNVAVYGNRRAFRFNYEFYYKNYNQFNWELLYKDNGGK